MKKSLLFLFLLIQLNGLFSQPKKNTAKTYFPPSGTWEKRSPKSAGFDTGQLNAAIRFAISNESKHPRDMKASQENSFGKEPFGEAIGLFADRGEPTGIIIHKGYIIAEWGEPSRVDMTHSVTKSFLSTVVGLAVDQKLIRNVNDPVADYITELTIGPKTYRPADRLIIQPFSSEHNKKITWETMLRQTSDWEGELWGKPDWADRPDKDSSKWHNRVRHEPGSVFEYNDVRVNMLALAATWVWQRSLPEIMYRNIMNPIGASSSWEWHGYYNSHVIIKNSPIESVSGGGHWGGGVFINAYDMARFGLLTLHKGNWNGKQLISRQWIEQSLQPTSANTGYGYMNFFLNTGKKYLPAAPASAYVHVGNGTNLIYVDPVHQLVMVVRWIENSAVKEMVKKVVNSLR